MENDNIIILNDNDGNEVKFEFLDLIPYSGKEYVALPPVSDEAVILQLEEVDDGTESYISVENELTLRAVFEIFKEKAKNVFNFVD